MKKKLTDDQEEELLLLLEQENRERVSPRLEAFRDPIIGGACDPKYRIRGCRGGRGAGAKSHSLVSLIVQRANYQNIRVGCFREIQESLEESVYALIKIKVEQLQYTGWIFQKGIVYSPCGSKFIFKGLKDLRASMNVKGLEAFDIYFIEEAAPISMESWNLLMPTLMRYKGSQLWFAYNPETEYDPVTKKIWNAGRDDALLIELKPGKEDNPWWPEGLQKEMDQDFKTDPDEAMHTWYGLPRTQGQHAILNRLDVRDAMDRHLADSDGQVFIGCDVARFGDDRTIIYKRKGLKVLECREFVGQDLMRTAAECFDMGDHDPTTRYAVDATGVGAGVCDRLRQLGCEHVSDVEFGSSPNDKDLYTTKADEMWFRLKDVLPHCDIPDDPVLSEELTGRQYDYDHAGRRKIESKEVYKGRMGRSPDKADALILCFSDYADSRVDRDTQEWMRRRLAGR